MAFDPVRIQSNPMQAFQVGRQLAGSNPVGDVLNKFIDQVNAKGLLQQKYQYDLGLQQEKMKMQTQANTDFLKGLQGQGIGGMNIGAGDEGNLQVSGVTVGSRGSSVQYSNPNVKKRPIPGGQLAALTQTNVAIARLEDLINTVKKTPMATGPFSGRFQRGPIANAYIQSVGSPEEVDFKGRSERFINSYLTAETGVQRGFKEIQYLATAIPNPAVDNPTNFLRKAESSIGEMKQKRNFMMQLLQQGGYTAQELQDLIDQGEVPEGFERVE